MLVAAELVPGISYDSYGSLLVASLLLGILNALVRPFLIALSLPLVVLSLGFFFLVINAAMLSLVAWMMDSFHVNGFWSAFFGSLVISFISLVLNVVTGVGAVRAEVRSGSAKGAAAPRREDGGGPIIDV